MKKLLYLCSKMGVFSFTFKHENSKGYVKIFIPTLLHISCLESFLLWKYPFFSGWFCRTWEAFTRIFRRFEEQKDSPNAFTELKTLTSFQLENFGIRPYLFWTHFSSISDFLSHLGCFHTKRWSLDCPLSKETKRLTQNLKDLMEKC